MEYLLENLEWLKDNFDNYSDDEYMILDCPGQVSGPCLFSKTQFLYCVHIFLHYCHGFWVLEINIQYRCLLQGGVVLPCAGDANLGGVLANMGT
jgi:hypothetical protein